MTLNIASYSEDERARLLSTFAHTPFGLGCGSTPIRCASVEGFWQGLRFPEGSDERARTFGLWGIDAKRAGTKAPPSDEVAFCGRRVRRGGPEHHALAELAMRAKLEQDPRVRAALLATDGLRLTHELVDDEGRPVPDSLTLPAAVFCGIWTKLRSELVSEADREGAADLG